LKIIPTGDRILGLVTTLTALGERESTIVIPEAAKEKKLVQVIVLEAGPKVEVAIPGSEEHELAKGDVVLVNNFAGTRVKYEDSEGEEELILVASREILAVVIPDEAIEVPE
jgi:co-chaperonin GroES (HSP10)